MHSPSHWSILMSSSMTVLGVAMTPNVATIVTGVNCGSGASASCETPLYSSPGGGSGGGVILAAALAVEIPAAVAAILAAALAVEILVAVGPVQAALVEMGRARAAAQVGLALELAARRARVLGERPARTRQGRPRA